MKTKMNNQPHATTTDQIIHQLQKGVGTWEQPWNERLLTLGETVTLYLNRETQALSDRCDAVINAMPYKPQIRHEEEDCFYNSEYDFINLPVMRHFPNPVDYHLTRFHLLMNATGATKRLGRADLFHRTIPYDELHSTEELVAELASCYLAEHVGIKLSELENNIAYIQQCLEWLDKDYRYISEVNGYAVKATNYLLNA